MRSTWDEIARRGRTDEIGDPARAAEELDALFGRLGGQPDGAVCVEVGCGLGRMTLELARRFEHVLAVDVSPAMLERSAALAREHGLANVHFGLVSGERLNGVRDRFADTVVCYLVLQHLPAPGVVMRYLGEFARVLAPGGEAFVQLPVLVGGVRPRAWRLARAIAVPAFAVAGGPTSARAFRGTRLTRPELDRGLAAAGLEVVARDEGPSAYRLSRDVFLRLRRPSRRDVRN